MYSFVYASFSDVELLSSSVSHDLFIRLVSFPFRCFPGSFEIFYQSVDQNECFKITPAKLYENFPTAAPMAILLHVFAVFHRICTQCFANASFVLLDFRRLVVNFYWLP